MTSSCGSGNGGDFGRCCAYPLLGAHDFFFVRFLGSGLGNLLFPFARAVVAGLAEASDERHLWRKLRATAQCLGITALRLSLEEQADGDTITRSTKPNGSGPWHSVGVAATDTVLMKMDYCRGAGELDARTIEPLKQALAAACARLYSPEVDARSDQVTS